jgi:hypothetical protein
VIEKRKDRRGNEDIDIVFSVDNILYKKVGFNVEFRYEEV